jgi:hypothetical protein
MPRNTTHENNTNSTVTTIQRSMRQQMTNSKLDAPAKTNSTPFAPKHDEFDEFNCSDSITTTSISSSYSTTASITGIGLGLALLLVLVEAEWYWFGAALMVRTVVPGGSCHVR